MKITDWLRGRERGRSGMSSPVVGAWRVSFISVPHPFGQYDLELRGDGVLQWRSIVPTRDAGEVEVSGKGTWRISGDQLHYISGDFVAVLTYSLEGQDLILDGLPATMVGPGVRCVLRSTQPTLSVEPSHAAA